jgi:formylglycine-generating enzyme required for sulfatase activity
LGCQGDLGKGFRCQSFELTAATVYACEGYRLPTDAEWEYAARAGTRTAFYSGGITLHPIAHGTCYPDVNLDRIAWFCHNAGPTTHRVGLKMPNGWGLHDTSGNVAEWVHDRHTGVAIAGAITDPGGDVRSYTLRIKRGSSFNAWATLCRSAARGASFWGARGPGLGFRLARTLPSGP